MTPEDHKWNVELVKDRYHLFGLTYEQAEKVYRYEQEMRMHSSKHYFSAWEEWDHALLVFRHILNDEQYVAYEAFIHEHTRKHEELLIVQDKEETTEKAYLIALLNFYTTSFLPDLLNDPFVRVGLVPDEQSKIMYLRMEYERLLNETKKGILAEHFRNYRKYRPNGLKLSLLQHQLLAVLPDYRSFEQQMDEPTRSVANFLKKRLVALPDSLEELLERKLRELKEFSEQNFSDHYGDMTGWNVILQPADKMDRAMMLLLLDEKKYDDIRGGKAWDDLIF